MEQKFIDILSLLHQLNSKRINSERINPDKYKTLVLNYYIKELHEAHAEFINILDKIHSTFHPSSNPSFNDNTINYKELYYSICKQNQQEGDFYRTFGPFLTLWSLMNENKSNRNEGH